MQHKYEIIEAFGLTVIPVGSLRGGSKAVLVDGQDVVLVRHDLADHEHDQVVDRLLAEALDCLRR